MNLTKEQVQLAINSGLEVFGPESDVQIPAKLNDGIFLLKQLLIGIGQGQIALAPATVPNAPEGAPTPPGAPNRKARRAAAKKVAKKVK